jgi:hypothetical protein
MIGKAEGAPVGAPFCCPILLSSYLPIFLSSYGTGFGFGSILSAHKPLFTSFT